MEKPSIITEHGRVFVSVTFWVYWSLQIDNTLMSLHLYRILNYLVWDTHGANWKFIEKCIQISAHEMWTFITTKLFFGSWLVPTIRQSNFRWNYYLVPSTWEWKVAHWLEGRSYSMQVLKVLARKIFCQASIMEIIKLLSLCLCFNGFTFKIFLTKLNYFKWE